MSIKGPTFPRRKAVFGDNASGQSNSQEFLISEIMKEEKKINTPWITYYTYLFNQTSQTSKHKSMMTLNSAKKNPNHQQHLTSM